MNERDWDDLFRLIRMANQLPCHNTGDGPGLDIRRQAMDRDAHSDLLKFCVNVDEDMLVD